MLVGRIRVGEGCLRVGGGDCLEYLKRGGNRKKGRERKILKGGGKLG